MNTALTCRCLPQLECQSASACTSTVPSWPTLQQKPTAPVTRSKLSCLSWNKYLKTYLASSDYEGVVHVWDIATGQNVAEYEAHEKRIWSVDFCHTDPMLLMSGSDDGMVKVSFSLCCFADAHT